jgi:hypothetical protein
MDEFDDYSQMKFILTDVNERHTYFKTYHNEGFLGYETRSHPVGQVRT